MIITFALCGEDPQRNTIILSTAQSSLDIDWNRERRGFVITPFHLSFKLEDTKVQPTSLALYKHLDFLFLAPLKVERINPRERGPITINVNWELFVNPPEIVK